ncbi:MAG: UDP-2,3-diacylglucosamine diphosphatase [Planctomycetota bacterium]
MQPHRFGRQRTASVRTLLISDVHLGCKHSQAAECLRFLRSYTPQTLYIVGDFIDGWKCNKGWQWSTECDEIVALIESWIGGGVRVFYVPGNHDSFLRQQRYRRLLPEMMRSVQIADEFIFESAHGWRFLVTHGDRFDFFETKIQWVSKGTSSLYDAILSLNWWYCWYRRALFGQAKSFAASSSSSLSVTTNPYAVCATLKDRVKRGVRFISRFESSISRHALLRGCEGVICGHIHTPDIQRDGQSIYLNTGDWVENCTGLVEHLDGAIHLESAFLPPRQLVLEPHPRCRANANDSAA